MNPTTPPNGALSAMVIPGIAVGTVLPAGLLSETFRSHFAAALTPGFQQVFFASVLLMALHKVESYFFEEYDQCPVYLSTGQTPWSKNPRQAVFLAFVPIFIGMMLVAYLAFLGPPWHLLIITVWLAQGAHELHHAAKSLARRRVYPGLVTSLLFVAVMTFGLFPYWHDAVIGERGLFFYGYYAALPLVFLGYYLEDRGWIARAPRSVWNPGRSVAAAAEVQGPVAGAEGEWAQNTQARLVTGRPRSSEQSSPEQRSSHP